MQSAYTNSNDDGSPEGRVTLQALARSLNLDEAALKVALEAAFELLPSVQNPGLALQMTLIRQGYRFESEAFWAVMHALRRNFGGIFDTDNDPQPSVPVPQIGMRENPYRTLPGHIFLTGTPVVSHDFAQAARGSSMGPPLHPPTRSPGHAMISSTPFRVADYQYQPAPSPLSQQWPGYHAGANAEVPYNSASSTAPGFGHPEFVHDSSESLLSSPLVDYMGETTVMGHHLTSLPQELCDPTLMTSMDYMMGSEVEVNQDQQWWMGSENEQDG
ncbi:hypothetical protein N0V83_010909 [Neocucurbitaria cava]|uniref:Uncharacterized protein n=1 Tax=Neocucurbitaria cava TaxID=798079 RepID=A0A9W8XY39_9PLEO|nr:hypothetical protein N0V83_010909 [Neocucurbitaria cava]